MQCEICGAEIRGKPHRVQVERSILEACGRCAQFGRETGVRSPVSYKISPTKPTIVQQRRRRSDIYDKMGSGIAEDFDEIIRNARKRKGWSQAELASRVKEKVNLIRKIERGEIIPEDETCKKIEFELGIKLADSIEKVDYKGKGGGGGLTLGDIVKIKRK